MIKKPTSLLTKLCKTNLYLYSHKSSFTTSKDLIEQTALKLNDELEDLEKIWESIKAATEIACSNSVDHYFRFVCSEISRAAEDDGGCYCFCRSYTKVLDKQKCSRDLPFLCATNISERLMSELEPKHRWWHQGLFFRTQHSSPQSCGRQFINWYWCVKLPTTKQTSAIAEPVS